MQILSTCVAGTTLPELNLKFFYLPSPRLLPNKTEHSATTPTTPPPSTLTSSIEPLRIIRASLHSLTISFVSSLSLHFV